MKRRVKDIIIAVVAYTCIAICSAALVWYYVMLVREVMGL